ncbi:MAG: aspartate 1-decarboxylase [Polyangiaceae bacterium]|nr:aspartate 1-decarboxylase [Polyangiaceae bacterium]
MNLKVFKSKIHRAVVTHADLDYEGSVTIDEDLMEKANILPHEEVHIWNITSGTRMSTYALVGPRGSGAICINGAAAHLNRPGELVILATFAQMSPDEARDYQPVVVRVDARNRIVDAESPEEPGDVLNSIDPTSFGPNPAPLHDLGARAGAPASLSSARSAIE